MSTRYIIGPCTEITDSLKAAMSYVALHEGALTLTTTQPDVIIKVSSEAVSFPSARTPGKTYRVSLWSVAASSNDLWYHNQQWYPILGEAIDAALKRSRAEYPIWRLEDAPILDEKHLRIVVTGELVFDSHYDYLNAVLDTYIRGVTGRSLYQLNAAGIVTAHGDKAYSYDNAWAAAGIPFDRGCLLYLQTRCDPSLTKTVDGQERGQWVIDNYSELLPSVQGAERAVLNTEYELPINGIHV